MIMRKGTVKFFDGARGFGFITDIQSGDDVFLHATALKACSILVPLNKGDVVFFDVGPARDGRQQVSKFERA